MKNLDFIRKNDNFQLFNFFIFLRHLLPSHMCDTAVHFERLASHICDSSFFSRARRRICVTLLITHVYKLITNYQLLLIIYIYVYTCVQLNMCDILRKTVARNGP